MYMHARQWLLPSQCACMQAPLGSMTPWMTPLDSWSMTLLDSMTPLGSTTQCQTVQVSFVSMSWHGLCNHLEYLHDLGLRQGSIYFTAIGVIISAFLRILWELYQLALLQKQYLKWTNVLEWCLFICSIIFVWVFNSVSKLQWQVGVVAVFLGWIGLINFFSKLPHIRIGVHILMFFNILKTVLYLIAFAFLLMLSFGLVFYMTFFEPGITVNQYY